MLGDYMDNVGAMRNTGVELTLGYQKKWGEWSFGAQANVSYNKNEILNLGGVDYLPDGNQRKAVGHALGTYYMYEADGFFASDEEAKAWMTKYSGQAGYPSVATSFMLATSSTRTPMVMAKSLKTTALITALHSPSGTSVWCSTSVGATSTSKLSLQVMLEHNVCSVLKSMVTSKVTTLTPLLSGATLGLTTRAILRCLAS